MSIEIYNKAKVIKKDDKYFYFLKYHSKNDCVCGGQVIVDDNFNDKYIRRNSRSGSWSVKAHGGQAEYEADKISETDWNCPTCYVYGQIRFGNKKNIALYWTKTKPIDYYSLTEMQQKNVLESIVWYFKSDYQCNLSNIPEKNRFKAVHTYCSDKPITLSEGSLTYKGHIYWNLDNL